MVDNNLSIKKEAIMDLLLTVFLITFIFAKVSIAIF